MAWACSIPLYTAWLARVEYGVFEVRLDGKLVWSRKEHGRFADIKELKQLVRDEIVPERGLGHSDAKPPQD